MWFNRIDRYVLTQVLGPFGFFALVFTGIIWLTQALGLVDRVIANNQSALVFLEFSTLILPRVLVSILPIAAFGAALYATNRLYAESEIVVIMASGRSNMRLIVPFLAMGLIVATIMFAMTFYLAPVSAGRLANRMYDIRNEVANSFIAEGEFVHPSSGVTLYVKDTSREGEMVGIFLHDQRDPANSVTYTAQKALLLRDAKIARLVMFDGIAQTYQSANGTLASVRFRQFSYDLSALIAEPASRRQSPSEYLLGSLRHPTADMLADKRFSAGDYVAEAHGQLSAPLLALIFPALAMASVMTGSYRRGGNGARLAIAVAAAAAIQLSSVLSKSTVSENPDMYLVSYLPPAVAALLTFYLLAGNDSTLGLPFFRRFRP